MSIFNFNRVYTEDVWPNDENGEPIFSMLIQNNDDFTSSIVDNVYGEQPYFSTIGQNPEYNRSGEE